MGENSESIQASLAILLTKIEAMDTRFSNLGKQLAATQENVDEIRHRRAEAGAKPTGSGVTEQGTSSASRPAPRLANLQPPLLEVPDGQSAGQVFTTAPPSPVEPVLGQEPPPEPRHDPRSAREHVPEHRRMLVQDRDRAHFIKPPKHHFPRFTGSYRNIVPRWTCSTLVASI
ncbi:uncharacterized protein LOC123430282 [Hordeum vulgare subsp. vulgare]|uniref:uncharacterized protein LOC123430282 n=1 Tax=Hordeum vulgare subsp. vulgare TaxID=112509 RepID=UPI001D1A5ABB|nr:uncharacterized protein LOC123430282 [Hordeum vulgare subsp. vulgare]